MGVTDDSVAMVMLVQVCLNHCFFFLAAVCWFVDTKTSRKISQVTKELFSTFRSNPLFEKLHSSTRALAEVIWPAPSSRSVSPISLNRLGLFPLPFVGVLAKEGVVKSSPLYVNLLRVSSDVWGKSML